MKLKNIYTQNNTNHFIRMYAKSMVYKNPVVAFRNENKE